MRSREGVERPVKLVITSICRVASWVLNLIATINEIYHHAYFRGGEIQKAANAYQLAIQKAGSASFQAAFLDLGTEQRVRDVPERNQMDACLWQTLVQVYRDPNDEAAVRVVYSIVRTEYEQASRANGDDLRWRYHVNEEDVITDPSQGNGYWINERLDRNILLLAIGESGAEDMLAAEGLSGEQMTQGVAFNQEGFGARYKKLMQCIKDDEAAA
jgi:hypothetical protein